MVDPQTRAAALRRAEERFRRQAETPPPRTLLSLAELPEGDLQDLLARAAALKADPHSGRQLLAGRSIALLFQKTSTRTRCSFERAATEMGAIASYIDWRSSNFMLADLPDEARVLSGYYDLIAARVYAHDTIRVLAAHSRAPVINAMCDRGHPCQAIADYLTIAEYFSGDLAGLRLAFIGDGNNVCRSLAEGAIRLGVQMTVCAPQGYQLDVAAVHAATQGPGRVSLEDDPARAVADADIVYTDTWVSMGQEAEMDQRRQAFAGWQVNADLLRSAPAHALVMHCLPAHINEEITAEILRGPRCIAWDQADNRTHAHKAVMEWALKER